MRARNIKPGYFKNEDLGSCDPLAQILFAGLWCLADRNGVLEDRPLRIKAEVFPFRDADVDALLDQLAVMTSYDHTPLVVRYLASGKRALFLPGFAKHQRIYADEKAGDLLPPDDVHRVQWTEDSKEPGNRLLLNLESRISNNSANAENAAAAAEDADVAELVAALVSHGLSPSLAQRHVAETADPALIREILRYCQANRSALRNPLGALRSMLKDSTSWGFERTERGWQGPKAVPKAGDVADRVAEARARIAEDNMRRIQGYKAEPVAHPGEIQSKIAQMRLRGR